MSIVTKIRRYSTANKFSIEQDKIIRDLAKMITTGQSSITKIMKYFELNPEEYKETFGDIKPYRIKRAISSLKEKK